MWVIFIFCESLFSSHISFVTKLVMFSHTMYIHLGVKKTSSGENSPGILLEVSNISTDIRIDMLSDDNFSEVTISKSFRCLFFLSYLFDNASSFSSSP